MRFFGQLEINCEVINAVKIIFMGNREIKMHQKICFVFFFFLKKRLGWKEDFKF